MQSVRALEGKLVMFFFFLQQKHVPIAQSAMLGGEARTINTSNGWSNSVKAKREFMKNKQITANVSQGQWSNYKHCCAIPRAVKKKTESWGMDKHQPFRVHLINGTQLIRTESRMMSSHPSIVLHFSTTLWLSTNTTLTPKIHCLHFTNKYPHVRTSWTHRGKA